jgi:transcriptional regulator with XRE-family HTH domain
MQDYGDVIRQAREARGWTQEELAGHSGVPKRTIQEIENGRVSKPQRATDLKHGCHHIWPDSRPLSVGGG